MAAQRPVRIAGVAVTTDEDLVVRSPFDGSEIQQLLRHADAAMYVAKQAGRNTWRFFGRNDRPPVTAMRKAAASHQGDDGLADDEPCA